MIIQNLAREKKWFTYSELNQRLDSFHYLDTDASSKPCHVNVKGDKLGGKAVQNWCLIRLLFVIVSDKIQDANDPVWQQFLLLHDIVELVCAHQIKDSGIAYLDVLIDEYLES